MALVSPPAPLAVVPEQRDQLPSVRDAQLVRRLQLVGRGRVRRPGAAAGRRGRRVGGREPPPSRLEVLDPA
eukprot:455466-Prymnesium_polylepis.1